MVKITVNLGDLRRLESGLLDDPGIAEVAAELATVSERQTQERFSRRRAPSGKPWAPRRIPASHPPLEKTGRLRRSIEAEGESHGGAATVELRAPVPYGQIIQHSRPFLGWSRRNQGELAKTAETFLERRFGRVLS